MTSAKNGHQSSSHPRKMKAVFWDGKPFSVSLKEIPFPKVLKPGDAVVRLTTAAICGSDLHTYHGVLGGSNVPYQLGHEGVGIVVEVGDAVQALKVGDRVIVPDIIANESFEVEPSLNFDVQLFGEGNLVPGLLGGTQGTHES